MTFTDDDLNKFKGTFGEDRTIKRLLARLEAAEKVIERITDMHYEDCHELDGGKCDCGTDRALKSWRKACGK